jgi:cytoskeletal protein RodZ
MADIGATLREARMRAKIDINEVEERTKIRAKYLRAIENEEWDLLPGEVYVKSFLRTYGDYLGLDTRQLLDDFRSRYGRPSDQELRPITPPGRDRDRAARGPLVPPWLVIAFVLAVVVAVLYVVGIGSKPKPPVPVNTSAGVTHPAHPHPHRRTKGRPAPAKADKVKLQLVPTGQVYVCLVTGTGKRLIPGQIFDTGQTIPTKTAPKLLLTLGNASVTMKVNGKSVPVPPSTSPIGYQLEPSGTRTLPPAKQPSCS